MAEDSEGPIWKHKTLDIWLLVVLPIFVGLIFATIIIGALVSEYRNNVKINSMGDKNTIIIKNK